MNTRVTLSSRSVAISRKNEIDWRAKDLAKLRSGSPERLGRDDLLLYVQHLEAEIAVQNEAKKKKKPGPKPKPWAAKKSRYERRPDAQYTKSRMDITKQLADRIAQRGVTSLRPVVVELLFLLTEASGAEISAISREQQLRALIPPERRSAPLIGRNAAKLKKLVFDTWRGLLIARIPDCEAALSSPDQLWEQALLYEKAVMSELKKRKKRRKVSR